MRRKYRTLTHRRPVKILIYQQKLSNLVQIFLRMLYILNSTGFPSSMKLGNATPVHRKGNRSEKGNYRPVGVLPNPSKVFERCIYKQIAHFFDKILFKHQCGFR